MRLKLYKNNFKRATGCFFITLFFFGILSLLTSCFAQNEKAVLLKKKAREVTTMIQQRHSQGGDVVEALADWKKVRKLAEQGRFDEADTLLDDIKSDLQIESSVPEAPSYAIQNNLFAKARAKESDKFAIWTGELDGKNLKLIISDPNRQMSHTRVSPDKKWIAFTRYNKKLKDGYAYEKGGYKYTETCIIHLDGTGLQTLAGPKPGILNCNPNWTSDSEKIIFMSTDNPQKRPYLYWINLKDRKITRVPTPGYLKFVSDPDHIGDQVVFAAPSIDSSPSPLWIMNEDGSNARQLSYPPEKCLADQKGPVHWGDYDPSFSPDGSKVTIFRNYGKDVYHIIVMDIITGIEKDLSTGKVAEGVADWSSDGNLLLFRHVNLENLKDYGLYTMRPDGSNRKKIPLPGGVLHNVQPSFFPGEGSTPQTRIVFSTEKVSFLDL